MLGHKLQKKTDGLKSHRDRDAGVHLLTLNVHDLWLCSGRSASKFRLGCLSRLC